MSSNLQEPGLAGGTVLPCGATEGLTPLNPDTQDSRNRIISDGCIQGAYPLPPRSGMFC